MNGICMRSTPRRSGRRRPMVKPGGRVAQLPGQVRCPVQLGNEADSCVALSGLAPFGGANPGRCPGLACCSPSGRKIMKRCWSRVLPIPSTNARRGQATLRYGRSLIAPRSPSVVAGLRPRHSSDRQVSSYVWGLETFGPSGGTVRRPATVGTSTAMGCPQEGTVHALGVLLRRIKLAWDSPSGGVA